MQKVRKVKTLSSGCGCHKKCIVYKKISLIIHWQILSISKLGMEINGHCIGANSKSMMPSPSQKIPEQYLKTISTNFLCYIYSHSIQEKYDKILHFCHMTLNKIFSGRKIGGDF